MQPEKMLGKIIEIDISNSRVILEIDFFDPDKQEMLEGFLKNKEMITFGFWKTCRQTKTYAQLKKYYKIIHIVLQKLGIYPNSEKVKAFDDEIKKRVFDCATLEIFDKRIPLLPSKANMSWEDMSKMIQYVSDAYSILLDDEY